MAKAVKKATVKKVTTTEDQTIIVNQIRIVSVDRSSKDIGDWKNAMERAEFVIHPNRVALYDLYSTVELDGHLEGIWKKRVSAVRNKNLVFKKNGKKVDEFDILIQSPSFRLMLRKIMEKKSHGLSGFEFIPGETFARYL